jgi:transcription elongation factor Elf1
MDDVLTDPCCCECGGVLTIVERTASFLTVVCADCGYSHGIEVTTARDGTPVYWPAFRISLISVEGEVSV